MSVIAKNQVVSFHYTLKDKEGKQIDSSVGGDPMLYLHGHGNIVPGLEAEMESKKVGDKLKVHVPPEKGYGQYDSERRFCIERSHLPADVELQPGMVLELHAEDGEHLMAAIVAVDKKLIEVDANHPMAGVDLHFEVEIMAIRSASPEEIEHGHVHGPGGHHH